MIILFLLIKIDLNNRWWFFLRLLAFFSFLFYFTAWLKIVFFEYQIYKCLHEFYWIWFVQTPKSIIRQSEPKKTKKNILFLVLDLITSENWKIKHPLILILSYDRDIERDRRASWRIKEDPFPLMFIYFKSLEHIQSIYKTPHDIRRTHSLIIIIITVHSYILRFTISSSEREEEHGIKNQKKNQNQEYLIIVIHSMFTIISILLLFIYIPSDDYLWASLFN